MKYLGENLRGRSSRYANPQLGIGWFAYHRLGTTVRIIGKMREGVGAVHYWGYVIPNASAILATMSDD